MKRLSTFSAGVLALFLLLAGCDVSNVSNDIEDALTVSLNIPPIETLATLQVLDASTGAAIPNATITYAGADADKVVDQFLFEPITTTNASTGIATFAFPDGLSYNDSDPYTVVALVRAPGYLGTSVMMPIGASGRFRFNARLFEASAPPSGVALTTQPAGTTDNTGTVQTATTVTTPATATGAVSVTVPAGTQSTTLSGAPAQGGLSMQVIYTSPSTPESAALLNASTRNVEVQRPDGSTSRSSFLPLGRVDVLLTDAAGNPIYDFSEPLEITIPISPDAINPSTGQPYQLGDEAPLLIQYPGVDRWFEAGTATGTGKRGSTPIMARVIERNGQVGFLGFIPSASDLQALIDAIRFALGGGTGISVTLHSGTIMTGSYTVILSGKTTEEVKITATAGAYSESLTTSDTGVTVTDVPSAVFSQISGSTPLTLTVTFEGEVVGTETITSLSPGGSATINVSIPETATGQLDLALDCSVVGKGTIRPSTDFQYARKNSDGTYVSPASTGTVSNGVASVDLRLGTTYKASVTYKDDTYERDFTTPATATAGTFDIEVDFTGQELRDVCNSL